MTHPHAVQTPSNEAQVASKAIVRAAAHLGLSNKVLSCVVGLSESTISRLGTGTYLLDPSDKAFELSLLLIRLYRSLDAIADGDDEVVRAWMRSENTALRGVPLQLIQKIQGLTDVVSYLDARRAVV